MNEDDHIEGLNRKLAKPLRARLPKAVTGIGVAALIVLFTGIAILLVTPAAQDVPEDSVSYDDDCGEWIPPEEWIPPDGLVALDREHMLASLQVSRLRCRMLIPFAEGHAIHAAFVPTVAEANAKAASVAAALQEAIFELEDVESWWLSCADRQYDPDAFLAQQDGQRACERAIERVGQYDEITQEEAALSADARAKRSETYRKAGVNLQRSNYEASRSAFWKLDQQRVAAEEWRNQTWDRVLAMTMEIEESAYAERNPSGRYLRKETGRGRYLD